MAGRLNVDTVTQAGDAMHTHETAEVIQRFNRAFEEHDPTLLADIVGQECVMETIQPAPDRMVP